MPSTGQFTTQKLVFTILIKHNGFYQTYLQLPNKTGASRTFWFPIWFGIEPLFLSILVEFYLLNLLNMAYEIRNTMARNFSTARSQILAPQSELRGPTIKHQQILALMVLLPTVQLPFFVYFPYFL
jgi:hypothetical protein